MVLSGGQANEPIISFPGIYPKKIMRNIGKDTCTNVSTEVLFIIAKIINNLDIWKQGKANVWSI